MQFFDLRAKPLIKWHSDSQIALLCAIQFELNTSFNDIDFPSEGTREFSFCNKKLMLLFQDPFLNPTGYHKKVFPEVPEECVTLSFLPRRYSFCRQYHAIFNLTAKSSVKWRPDYQIASKLN